MGILNLAIAGDSTIQGVVGGAALDVGGLGNSSEQLAERLGNSPYGPLIGSGVLCAWKGLGTTGGYWTKTGTWFSTGGTNLFNKWVLGEAFYGGNGVGSVATITKPAALAARSVISFAIHYIDYATGSGGGAAQDGSQAGQWSYRIDGGAWTNAPAALNDNGLKKLYVNAPVTSTIDFRQANAAGTTQGICIAAVEYYYVDPTTATHGCIVHNFGRNQQFLINFAAQGVSGDPLAWFDSEVLLNGAPDHKPSIVMSQFTNDARIFGGEAAAAWTSQLTTIYNRVKSYATYIPCGSPDQADANPPTTTTLAAAMNGVNLNSLVGSQSVQVASTTGFAAGTNTAATVVHNGVVYTIAYTATDATHLLNCTAVGAPNVVLSGTEIVTPIDGSYNLAQYRAASKAFAAANPGVSYWDQYDAWASIGYVGWAATFAAGLMNDNLHPSQAGHIDQAERWYWMLRSTETFAGETSQDFSLPPITQVAPFTVGQSRMGTHLLAGQMIAVGQPPAPTALLGTETVVRAAPFLRPVTDALLGTELAAEAPRFARAVTDALVGTEAIARSLVDARATSATLIAETIASTSHFAQATVADAILGEVLGRLVTASPRVAADALLTEAIAASYPFSRSVVDALLAGETVLVGATHRVISADDLLGGEVLTRGPHPLSFETLLGTEVVSVKVLRIAAGVVVVYQLGDTIGRWRSGTTVGSTV